MPRAKLRLTLPEGVWIGDLSRSNPEATFRVLAAMADDGRGVALVEVAARDVAAITDAMAAYGAVVEREVLVRDGERALVQFETTTPLLLTVVQGSGVPLELPFDIVDGEAAWEVTASRDRLSELGRQLAAFGVDYVVEWVQHDPEPDRLLTDRQLELLREAVDRGYYDTPRECTLTELAAGVGIAKSTCSETLHRAEAAVVKHHLRTLASAGGRGAT